MSKAATVDEYLAEVPSDRTEVLTQIRDLCRDLIPDADERMQWGMPAYLRGEEALVAFASQKQYLSFYVMNTEIRDQFADRLAGHDMGSSCLRFRSADRVDLDLIADLIRAAAG